MLTFSLSLKCSLCWNSFLFCPYSLLPSFRSHVVFLCLSMCNYTVATVWQQWCLQIKVQWHVVKRFCCLGLWHHWCPKQKEHRRVGSAFLPLLASSRYCFHILIVPQLTCLQPWEPEPECGIPPELWRIISCPHSRWLDSCRPRPVVSIGSAQEAMAAKRQQQQYTERARYTEDSNITCRMEPRNQQNFICSLFFILNCIIIMLLE